MENERITILELAGMCLVPAYKIRNAIINGELDECEPIPLDASGDYPDYIQTPNGMTLFKNWSLLRKPAIAYANRHNGKHVYR